MQRLLVFFIILILFYLSCKDSSNNPDENMPETYSSPKPLKVGNWWEFRTNINSDITKIRATITKTVVYENKEYYLTKTEVFSISQNKFIDIDVYYNQSPKEFSNAYYWDGENGYLNTYRYDIYYNSPHNLGLIRRFKYPANVGETWSIKGIATYTGVYTLLSDNAAVSTQMGVIDGCYHIKFKDSVGIEFDHWLKPGIGTIDDDFLNYNVQ